MAQVRWTPQAADDLEAICLFIVRDAPQVAAAFAGRILAATDRLTEYPRLGRSVPELRSEDLREIIVGSFRVIYRIRNDVAQVLTIHHGARRLDTTTFEPSG